MNQGWQLKQERLADYRIFQVVRKYGRSPRTGKAVDYFSLEAPDWVQVIPITMEGKLIMVEQFRPGAEVSSLEFPAGLVDHDESAKHAAARELEEETGFTSVSWHELGSLYANPAIQSNRLHILLAEQCRRTSEPQQDEGEDVHLRVVEAKDVPVLLRSGEINHALVLTAWQLYELWRVQRAASRT